MKLTFVKNYHINHLLRYGDTVILTTTIGELYNSIVCSMVTWFVEIQFGSHSIWILYDLYKSLGSDQSPIRCGSQNCESHYRSLQFVETLWESLLCGSQQISTLCEDLLWTTLFYFVWWCWQWLLTGWLSLWISEFFQK